MPLLLSELLRPWACCSIFINFLPFHSCCILQMLVKHQHILFCQLRNNLKSFISQTCSSIFIFTTFVFQLKFCFTSFSIATTMQYCSPKISRFLVQILAFVKISHHLTIKTYKLFIPKARVKSFFYFSIRSIVILKNIFFTFIFLINLLVGYFPTLS